jgi:CHAT domain-containing protein
MPTRVLLAGLVVLLATRPFAGEPLTPEERGRLDAEAEKTYGDFWRLYQQGRMPEALDRAERLLALNRQLYPKEQFPDGHLALASSLSNMGNVLKWLGRLEEALKHQQQALAMYRLLFPPTRFPAGHNAVAGTLNNVGLVLETLGRREGALEHHQQALAMYRQLFPADKFPDGHPNIALSLSNAGVTLLALGRLEGALEHHQQALAMRHKLFPADKLPAGHPALADSLSNMGSVLRSLGRLEEALEHQQQALAMYRQLFPAAWFPNGHPNIADSLDSVGLVLGSLDRLAAALEHQQQALAMRRQLYPADRFPDGHPSIALSLNNVGVTLVSLGRREEALEHKKEALALYRQLYSAARFPDGHPQLAGSLSNVGNVLWSLGRFEAALEHQQQALALFRKLYPADRFPDGHPYLADSLTNVGVALLATGQRTRAADFLAEALRLRRGLIDQVARAASEAEALAFARQTSSYLDNYLFGTAGRPEADGPVYALIWSQRGALRRLQQRRHLATLAAAGDNPGVGRLFERLQQTGHELAALLRTPLPEEVEGQRRRDRRVNELTGAKQRLERDLAALLPEVDRQRRLDRLGPADLARALPADAAFVDLLHYTRAENDPNKPGDVARKVTASYVAFVVVPGRAVRRVELGEARANEEALADGRHLIEQGKAPDQPEAAGRLRRLLWEPLQEALPKTTRTVFLAPDAALTRLPFAALPGSQCGTVLLQDHALAVVPDGTFLLEQLQSPGRFDRGRRSALALGGVGYGEAGASPEPQPVWAALPGSARELQLLHQLYGDSLTRLRGSQADVSRLLHALPRAALAHLATHGFYNERLFRHEQQRTQRQITSLQHAQPLRSDGPGGQITQGALNPLSYTGLVLAGANQPRQAGVHGGILTGEALLSLDLRGLELAVLSACQTGLGEVATGECVHNLQQAFHSAGCPNVIAALWSVPDEATAALMGLFYHALLEEKQSPLDALRSAQLYLYRHPEKVSELAQRLERGAPLLAQGVKVAQPETKPKPPPTVENKRAAVKDWAAFVLSGIGR